MPVTVTCDPVLIGPVCRRLLQDLTSLDGTYEEDGLGTDDSSSTGQHICLRTGRGQINCFSPQLHRNRRESLIMLSLIAMPADGPL
jgi:hypothetical protein